MRNSKTLWCESATLIKKCNFAANCDKAMSHKMSKQILLWYLPFILTFNVEIKSTIRILFTYQWIVV